MIQKLLPGELEQQDRAHVIREELRFLAGQGVRDPDVLARQLGFTGPVAMERFLYRYDMQIPYRPPQQEQEYQLVAFDRPESDAHLYGRAFTNTPEQITAAIAAVRRHERDRPEAVPELLAMLGLPTEQQLTPAS